MSTESAPTAAARAFTPAEAALITGVPQKLQLAWRHREHLPAGDGRSWTEWDHAGLCKLLLLREFGDRGLPLRFARGLAGDPPDGFLADMQAALARAITEAAAGALAGIEAGLEPERLAVVAWWKDGARWFGAFGFDEVRAELERETTDRQAAFGFQSCIVINLSAHARTMARRILMLARAEALQARQRTRRLARE